MTQHPIAAFLLARYDEAEQRARATAYSQASSVEDSWSVRQKDRRDEMSWAVYSQGKYVKASDLYEADARHIAAHDPVSVLADIAAKRDVVSLCLQILDDTAIGLKTEAFAVATLKLLARPFAQHPDYQEDWRP